MPEDFFKKITLAQFFELGKRHAGHRYFLSHNAASVMATIMNCTPQENPKTVQPEDIIGFPPGGAPKQKEMTPEQMKDYLLKIFPRQEEASQGA